jgi:hypothetical protein
VRVAYFARKQRDEGLLKRDRFGLYRILGAQSKKNTNEVRGTSQWRFYSDCIAMTCSVVRCLAKLHKQHPPQSNGVEQTKACRPDKYKRNRAYLQRGQDFVHIVVQEVWVLLSPHAVHDPAVIPQGVRDNRFLEGAVLNERLRWTRSGSANNRKTC